MSIPIMPEQAQHDDRVVSVGIDLSMTDTGIAAVTSSGLILTSHVTSSPPKDTSLLARCARLERLLKDIGNNPVVEHADHVVIEGPAYASHSGKAHERAGLWWLLVWDLLDQFRYVHVASPSTLKKYATGKGNASKDEVVAAVVRRFPQADVTNNNVADAVVLAAIGARRAGWPVDDLTKQRAAAFEKVQWAA